jgi:hypothetical protein
MPEVALCIRGQDRFANNSGNFKNMIVDPLNADVFLAIRDGNTESITHQTLSPVASNYTDYSFEDLYRELLANGFNQTYWNSIHSDNALAPWKGSRGGALFQYRALKECYDLIEEYETNQRGGVLYKWVIIMRSDHWCLAKEFPLGLPEEANVVYVPSGLDTVEPRRSGLNDRMIAMPRSISKHVLTGSWEKLVNNTNASDFTFNPEMAHKRNVDHAMEGIATLKRTESTCFLACVPGVALDPTSWTKDCFPDNQTGAQGYKKELEYQQAESHSKSRNEEGWKWDPKDSS